MTTVTYCPICKTEIWREEPIEPKEVLPGWDPSDINVEVTSFMQRRAVIGERKIKEHLADRHPFRYWLWKRTHWKRALGVHA